MRSSSPSPIGQVHGADAGLAAHRLQALVEHERPDVRDDDAAALLQLDDLVDRTFVQVYGDVAILTYSYTGVTQTKDGKTDASTGKSTRVYARQNGQWKLVHAHFSSVEIPKD